MSGFVGKLVFNHILKETRENNQGHDDDPYFESVPTKKLSTFSGKPKMKKRKKALPPGLSEEDQQTLVKVKRRAYRLDMALGTFCGIKIGWGSVIGIFPGIGDVIDTLLAIMVIRTAAEVGLPKSVMLHMLFNVAFDFVIGLVPFIGDLADMAYKANTRNALILENYLRQRGRENLRKSGLPQQPDPSLDEVEIDEDVVSNQPITQPQPSYGGPSRGYSGARREYDPESHRGIRGGDSGGGASRQKSSKDKSSRDKSSRDKSSRDRRDKRGHARLYSQETRTTTR